MLVEHFLSSCRACTTTSEWIPPENLSCTHDKGRSMHRAGRATPDRVADARRGILFRHRRFRRRRRQPRRQPPSPSPCAVHAAPVVPLQAARPGGRPDTALQPRDRGVLRVIRRQVVRQPPPQAHTRCVNRLQRQKRLNLLGEFRQFRRRLFVRANVDVESAAAVALDLRRDHSASGTPLAAHEQGLAPRLVPLAADQQAVQARGRHTRAQGVGAPIWRQSR